MLSSTFVVLLSPVLLWVTDVTASPAPKAAPLPQNSYPTDPCALKGYDQKCCTVLDKYDNESKHLCDEGVPLLRLCRLYSPANHTYRREMLWSRLLSRVLDMQQREMPAFKELD